LSLPQPPSWVSVCRIASLRSDFADPDTSAVHGWAELEKPPPAAGGLLAVPVPGAAAVELGPGLDTVWDPHPIHVAAITPSTAKVDLMSAQRPF
jgi:hypothetical protein